MPTYEYECKSCSHTFEAFQSMKDDPLTECPECGKSVRRLINGGSGIIFKGSGFYVTDKGKASSAGAVNSAKKESGAAGEGSKSSQSPAASSSADAQAGAKKSDTPPAPSSPAPKSAAAKTAKA